jgi:tyrosine-protein kinase Etk/Wzc
MSLGGLSDLFSMGSGFDTELEIIASRSVIGAVVDSLGLQVRVQRPHGVAPLQLFDHVSVESAPARATYRFERSAHGWSVSGPGAPGRVAPGELLRLPGATLVLRPDAPADAYTVRLLDREEAIERVERRLRARKAGGDVAELTYRAPDRATAAALPNALVAKYLDRRVTTDRGVNQHRYEFLLAHTDSIRQQLTIAGQTLRRYQEASGVIDPEMQGKAELEQGLALRADMEAAEVEARALQGVLAGAAAGTLSPREIAAYPTFLSNPAINQLLTRLVDAETRRTELLDRRTEADPDVQILDRTVGDLEAQLVTLSRAYLDGLNRRQAQLRTELRRYDATFAALPAQAEANF